MNRWHDHDYKDRMITIMIKRIARSRSPGSYQHERSDSLNRSYDPDTITNLDENKWEDGFDSAGEQGPVFHAVVDEPADGVAEEDDNLPSSMLESAVMESKHSPEDLNTVEPDDASQSWILTETQIMRL